MMPAEIMHLAVRDPLADVVGEYVGAEPQVLPAPASRDEALVRAASIREGIERFAREVIPQITQAYLCRDWAALGYPSWDSYVRGEFGLGRLKLPRDDRQHAAAAMRLVGMSTRAIGSALGVDQKTVRNDLDGQPVDGAQPPAEVLGADGKRYPAARPAVEEPPAGAGVPPVEELAADSSHSGPAAQEAGDLPASSVPAVDAPDEPQRAPAHAVAPAAEPVELRAGPVRIRVRPQRRSDGTPVVALRLIREDRTIGEEWIEADSNDDPLECAAALDEDALDEVIDTLLDAQAQLRRMRGAS